MMMRKNQTFKPVSVSRGRISGPNEKISNRNIKMNSRRMRKMRKSCRK
jgi:hypothetical protein